MKTEICPYCKQKFIIGYIKTNGEGFTWVTDKKGNHNSIVGGRVKTYCCSTCEKIIIIEDDRK